MVEVDDQKRKSGWGRRIALAGAALGAVVGGAAAFRRRQGRAAVSDGPPAGGPVIGDLEFLEDERSVFEAYKDADIDGWHTRIIDRGEGEAIFFVPIIGGLEVVYSKQLREFARTNRVLFYERQESLDRPVFAEERVEELRRVMDHCGVERAHIVGLGDAGVPTFNFGRIHPGRALSLTSLCLGPRYRVPPYWLNEGIINPLTERLPIEGLVPNRLIRAMIIKGTYGNGRLPAHLIGHMVDHIAEQMRVHKFSVLPVTHHHEMRDWAHTLRVPTLLINRDDDPLAPVEEMEELAQQLPNCHGLKVFRDGGRFITYTWADAVNGLLRAFFATVAAGTPAPVVARTEVMPV